MRTTVALDEDDFFTRLTHDRTVTGRLRESERNPGQITGYAVHLSGDAAADDGPISYGGGRLAADLSLTRLRQRWQPDTTLAGTDHRARQLRPVPAEIYERAASLIADAASHIRTNAHNPRVVVGTIAAAAGLLAATAAAWEGTAGGPIARFDQHHDSRQCGRARSAAALKAMLRLVEALAGLADAIGELRAVNE